MPVCSFSINRTGLREGLREADTLLCTAIEAGRLLSTHITQLARYHGQAFYSTHCIYSSIHQSQALNRPFIPVSAYRPFRPPNIPTFGHTLNP
jgi:hypothetical protein